MRKKIPLVASLLVALVAHVLTAAINIRASHSTSRSSDLSSDLSDNSLIEQSIEQSIDPSIDQLIDPSNDPLPSVRLGYADIFTPEKLEFVNNTDNYEIPGCEARQIYLMSRHGTRTPGAGHLELQQEFLAKYKELQKKGKLSKVHRVFDDIHLSFTDAPAHSLTWLGAQELQTIAARYKRRYPRLFSKDAAHKGKIDVLSSDIQRAIDSGHNFLRGLFGKDDLLYESLASLMRFDNYTMRAFDRTCPKYIQLVKGNNNAFTEERTFASGEEMKKLVDKFIKTHSLDGMQDYITPSLLRALYVICSNEQTHKMNKNWCKAFTSEYFYPIGYSDELFCYNIFGPGHAENLLVAHPLFRDVVHNIEAFIYKDLYDPTAHVFTTNLRFGHLENLAPMLAVLDLFIPDEPLRADNYDAYVHKRKYTVFNYTPFAAEIAFVLHKCPMEGRDLMSQYKVHVLVNEQPVKMLNTGPLKCTQKKLPENRLVDDGSLCDFVHFKDQLLPFIDQTTEDACAYP